MLIHRFNPSDHFRTMDMLFDAMRPSAATRRTNFVRKPAKFTLEDKEEAFILRAELPGLKSEALEISVGEDWLELKAARAVAVPEGYEAIRRERAGYRFERRVNLPKRVDGDAVEATLREGQLTITLPKRASVTPRSVAIKAA